MSAYNHDSLQVQEAMGTAACVAPADFCLPDFIGPENGASHSASMPLECGGKPDTWNDTSNSAGRDAALDRTPHKSDWPRMERQLWRYLVAQAGRTVSRDELLRRVWGLDPRHVVTRTVDMHIANLRKKLGEPPRRPRLLQTVRGAGYRVKAGSRISTELLALGAV